MQEEKALSPLLLTCIPGYEDMMVGAAAAILQQEEGPENFRDTDRGVDIIQVLKYSLKNC